jgi:hypothetical protein
MISDRMERALTRLDAAIATAEAAGKAAVAMIADSADTGELQERHQHLKESVALSLRQLDDILASLPAAG